MSPSGTITIAIDGEAASGKGTIARALATELNLPYLDTGLVYRKVAWDLMSEGSGIENRDLVCALASRVIIGNWDDNELRSEAVAQMACQVAALADVRSTLLMCQRSFANKGAVLDGRDIGTVVLPDATAKLYFVADPDVRAKRRLLQFGNTNAPEVSVTRESLVRRDQRDKNRSVAPLLPASDARILDTTDQNPEVTLEIALEYVREQIKKRSNQDCQNP